VRSETSTRPKAARAAATSAKGEATNLGGRPVPATSASVISKLISALMSCRADFTAANNEGRLISAGSLVPPPQKSSPFLSVLLRYRTFFRSFAKEAEPAPGALKQAAMSWEISTTGIDVGDVITPERAKSSGERPRELRVGSSASPKSVISGCAGMTVWMAIGLVRR